MICPRLWSPTIFTRVPRALSISTTAARILASSASGFAAGFEARAGRARRAIRRSISRTERPCSTMVLESFTVGQVADDGWNGREARRPRGPPTPFAGDELEPLARAAQEHRLDDPGGAD